MDAMEAEKKALELIAAEMGLQNNMWGNAHERDDASKGQLFHAGFAQLEATLDRQMGFDGAFIDPPHIYPADWSGFRSYGADIPNMVVGVAFLIQEIKRKLMNGEDTTRLARGADQAYSPETGLPNKIEG